MSDSPPGPATQKPVRTVGGDVLLTLVSAGLFLYVGFGLGMKGISGEALYDISVAALVWGARFVGVGLLLMLGLSYLRAPGAAILDLVLSTVAAAGCLVSGVIWVAARDMDGVLLLLFGLLNASAVRGAWQRWVATRRRSPPAT